MSDDRLNRSRCETKASPLKFCTEPSALGLSEYAIAYVVQSPASARPVTATVLNRSDSEYNQAFGPKAPYKKPAKPSWMLDKYKSGFDLKCDPNAKFDGTTIYKETFMDKSTEPPPATVETLYAASDDPEVVCISEPESGTCVDAAAGDSTTSVSKISDIVAESSELKQSVNLMDLNNNVKSETKEPEIKIVYSSYGELKPKGACKADADVKVVSPRPLPPKPKSRLGTPIHGRKKVQDEPSLYATPGLRYFMESIRR